jgi:hypothetical protein
MHTLPWLPSRDRPVTIVAITIQTATGRRLEIKKLGVRRPVFPASGTLALQSNASDGIPAGLKPALDMLPGEKWANMPGPIPFPQPVGPKQIPDKILHVTILFHNASFEK